MSQRSSLLLTAGSETMPRVADPRAKITLLRAAEEVFAERGLAAAKVEDIARRAGLSKGAFYLHFESKEGALKHIVESFLARCGSFFAPPSEYPGLPEDADALVDFTIERDLQMYEFLWQNRAILRILPTCHGAYDYLIEAFRAETDQRNREWLTHYRAIGLFRPDADPELCNVLIAGAYDELTQRMVRCETRPPLEQWVRFAQETFIRAYGTSELIDALERRNRRVTIGIRRAAQSSGSDSERGRL